MYVGISFVICQQYLKFWTVFYLDDCLIDSIMAFPSKRLHSSRIPLPDFDHFPLNILK